MMIHETAVIDSSAQLGENVSVGPYTCIEGDVKIGDGCKIGPQVTIMKHTTLGRDCQVHSGAVLGDIPQDTGFKGYDSFVEIGDSCIIREGVTIHRGTEEGSNTVIGDGCFLMAFSHFAHNVKLGDGVIAANGVLLAGYVEVGPKAFLSGNAVVHQFVKIGRLVMLGGGCGVSKDVPPFCTVRPVSLNDVAGINAVGMKRSGMDRADLAQVKQAFKELYKSGKNVSQALADLEQEFSDGPVMEMIDFIKAAERGIC
ncbi:acyl-[acyl-carrier-protein]--UDP-N-acetylglucosamine O-acyltransferase [bacterium E08(2017)]|nr:acyl-[acyl-carrier-protein]--UDP-N-acetylglucosamine O-acyltransferase [bacterium E08(2017)]